jgi:hypothetical protein
MVEFICRLAARLGLSLIVFVVVLAWPLTGGNAEDASPAPAAPKTAVAEAPLQVNMPTAQQLMLLIRSSLLTFGDATQSGNYSVLRDLAAPGFRQANSPEKLAKIFSSFASKGVDLSGVAVLTPQLAGAPVLDPKTNRLYLKGAYPGDAVTVVFELLYEPVGGKWRLFGIFVDAAPGQVTAVAPAAAPAAIAEAAAAPEKPATKQASKKSKKVVAPAAAPAP